MPLPWYYHLLTPDWMQHSDLADVLERQQSDANSLERRVELLERQLQDQQRHIQGLEALLAAHGITPPPVPEEEPPQAAVFPARTRETITCPRCGARQRGDRDSCYVCSLPFQYESE